MVSRPARASCNWRAGTPHVDAPVVPQTPVDAYRAIDRRLFGGRNYSFCSVACKRKFDETPSLHDDTPPAADIKRHEHEHRDAQSSLARVMPGAGSPRYTCPMHPEIVRDAPGSCPKYGMALVPVMQTIRNCVT